MTLTSIAIFIVGALIYGFLVPARWRGWVLFVGSILAIYWLQPALSVRPLDFVLPTATLILGLAGWLITRQESGISRENMISLGVLAIVVALLAVIGGIAATTPLGSFITPSPPPDL